MENRRPIDILLATYNGVLYLEEQLNSILDQTDSDWQLLIRDDGSNDGTPGIIKRFADANPDRVSVMDDRRGNVGIIDNFAELMACSAAEYVMFCDQDDIWRPDKIANCRAAMVALEARYGRGRPLLVHSDLRIVDEKLRDLKPSYFGEKLIDPVRGRALQWLLVQNIAPGCAMMINRKLCDLAVPIPKDALMHDWWAMLIAASLGGIDCVAEPLVLYRQHADNSAGANLRSLRKWISELMRKPFSVYSAENRHFRGTQRQAAALLEAHGAQMDDDVYWRTSRYATIAQRNFLARRIDLLRLGFFSNQSVRKKIRLLFFV